MSDIPLKARLYINIKIFLTMKVITFFIWLIGIIIKRANAIREVPIHNTFLLACDLFPDNAIKDGYSIATDVFIHLTLDEDEEAHELNEQATQLLVEVLKDKDITSDLSKYYLVIAFAYSMYGMISETFKDKESMYLAKAVKLDPNAEPLKENEVHKLTKQYKKKAALLVKERRATIKERINDKRAKEIPSIGITPSNIAIIISIISTIFVISGYYYIKQLLGHFGLNSSDFYSLNDYTLASLDYAVTPLIWTGIFTVFSLLGAYDVIGERIWREQLDIPDEIKTYKDDPLGLSIFLVTITNTFFIFVYGYNGEHVPSHMLMFNIMVVGFYILNRLPFRLFTNPMTTYICVSALMIFSFYIVMGVNADLDKHETGTYKPKYIVEFVKPEPKEDKLDFLVINSTYIFMLDKDDKKLKAIPRSKVKELTPNPETEDKNFLMSIFDYFKALAEIIDIIYKHITSD